MNQVFRISEHAGSMGVRVLASCLFTAHFFQSTTEDGGVKGAVVKATITTFGDM